MKKIVLFSMGLLACLAFSPQSASAAPDTGPKVDNIEVVDNTSASANLIMPKQGVSQVSITNQMTLEASIINFCAFVQTGQETVVHRSDHSVGNTNYLLNYVVNSKNSVNSNGLAAVDDRQRPCKCMIMNGYSTLDLDLSKNSTGLPFVGDAQRSHQLVWVMKRPAWTKPYYLRC